MFEQVEVTQGVFYGANTGSSGANVELDMDIYRPVGMWRLNRPLVILAHGGFFWPEATTGWMWCRVRGLGPNGLRGGVHQLPFGH